MSNKLSKSELKQRELIYYTLQQKYLETEDEALKKKYWDEMFFMMQDAVTFALKKFLFGIKRNDIDELALDATIQVMNRYKKPNGYNIEHILTIARFAALGVLYNKKQQFHDSCMSYEAWESWQYAEEERR